MKKFRYRLQPLLDLRTHYEREWEIKLAEATGRCVLLRKELGELSTEKENIRLRTGSGFDMGTAVAADLYRQRLEARIEDLKAKLDRTEEERKRIEASYFAASRDRKIIEKLKERKVDEYRRERLSADVKTSDEVAGSGPARELLRE